MIADKLAGNIEAPFAVIRQWIQVEPTNADDVAVDGGNPHSERSWSGLVGAPFCARDLAHDVHRAFESPQDSTL